MSVGSALKASNFARINLHCRARIVNQYWTTTVHSFIKDTRNAMDHNWLAFMARRVQIHLRREWFLALYNVYIKGHKTLFNCILILFQLIKSFTAFRYYFNQRLLLEQDKQLRSKFQNHFRCSRTHWHVPANPPSV